MLGGGTVVCMSSFFLLVDIIGHFGGSMVLCFFNPENIVSFFLVCFLTLHFSFCKAFYSATANDRRCYLCNVQ